MIGGMALHSPWLIIAGFFIMIGAQIEDQGVFFQSVVDTVHMREVMLTDFATLSPVRHAGRRAVPLRSLAAGGLSRCARTAAGRHRLAPAHRRRPAQRRQWLYPVGHVARLPGGAARRHARHHDPAHHRGPGLSLIPVTESGKVVGIVSVQNLMSSMSLLAEQRRIEARRSGRVSWQHPVSRSQVSILRLMASDALTSSSRISKHRPLAPGLYLVATPIGNLGDITLRALECSSASTASPAKTRGRRRSFSTISASPRPPRATTSTTSASAPSELIEASKRARASRSSPMPACPASAIPDWLAAAAIAGRHSGHSHSRRQCGAQRAGGLGPAHRRVSLPRISAGKGRRPPHPPRKIAARARDAARTLIFYEAPHRILDTLADLEAVFGAGLRVVLARELTKVHEEFLRGTVAEVRQELSSRDRIRGEMTLLVEAPAASEANALAKNDDDQRPRHPHASRVRHR